MSCTFIGCHPTRFRFKYKENYTLCKKIKAALLEQAKALYNRGARRFYVGGALGVDMWAGEAVLSLKGMPEYLDIELVCVVPFVGHDNQWDAPSKQRFAKLLAGCDEKIAASSPGSPDAYKIRNYYMLDHSDDMIAVYDGDEKERSSTGQAVNYARKRRLDIILIHPDTAQVSADSKKN